MSRARPTNQAEEISPMELKIEGILSRNPIVIFSKSTCYYCELAKNLFQKTLGMKIKTYELDKLPDGSEMQSELTRLTKQATVPYIFLYKKFFGGFSGIK